MVGLQFAFRLPLKSCSLQPAGLQKPFSKYLSSYLGFICMLGFFNPKMHTTDSPTLPTIKPDTEFCTDWCAIKKLVHPTLLHIHPDVVGCWLSSSFVSINSTFTKPSFLSCSSSFFFLFEYSYKCDRTSLHYCARVEDSAPIFFDKMKVLQKLFDFGDRLIVNVDSKLKKAQSSGWVNSQRLPATTLFQNYSGAAQICHLLRRTLKL